mmetsp:Transcript_29778/g.91673  ORF Transcript_29778/g.91673 Transcript_29778/m.91673 type:complete len:222 (+) Transcript_29778:331-996(+)
MSLPPSSKLTVSPARHLAPETFFHMLSLRDTVEPTTLRPGSLAATHSKKFLPSHVFSAVLQESRVTEALSSSLSRSVSTISPESEPPATTKPFIPSPKYRPRAKPWPPTMAWCRERLGKSFRTSVAAVAESTERMTTWKPRRLQQLNRAQRVLLKAKAPLSSDLGYRKSTYLGPARNSSASLGSWMATSLLSASYTLGSNSARVTYLFRPLLPLKVTPRTS